MPGKMRTLQRLYMRDFLTALFLVAPGLSVVFSLLDLINRIDEFPSAALLLVYAFFIAPKYIVYLLPMAVLICSLFTFGQAYRRREITAVKVAGGRLKTLFAPFVFAGLLLSVTAFITSEFIVPDFSRKAANLKNSLTGREKQLAINEEGIWLKADDGSPVKIDLYVKEQQIAKGVHIFVYGKDFLKERIFAEKAAWNGTTWVLEEVTRYDIDTGEITRQKTMHYAGLESPALFAEEIRSPDEMGISELYRYNQRLKKTGFKNAKLLVDLHSKISFPLVNVFMILLGISIAVRGRLGSGLFSAGFGLLLSLVYWFSYTFFLSLGYAGVIHPFFSAWITPFAFGSFSVYFFHKIPE